LERPNHSNRFQINQIGMSSITGKPDPLKTDGYGRLLTNKGLVSEPFDYVIESDGGVTSIFNHKLGGASGTDVAEVTVTYTDSDKCTFVSAERTDA